MWHVCIPQSVSAQHFTYPSPYTSVISYTLISQWEPTCYGQIVIGYDDIYINIRPRIFIMSVQHYYYLL